MKKLIQIFIVVITIQFVHNAIFAQSTQSKIKTEQVQITDCSNSPMHFRGQGDDKQFFRFASLYNDFLENKKVFYLPNGSIEKIEKYYLFIKPITETYTYEYSKQGKKETVTIKKDKILETKYITDPDKGVNIKEEYADGVLFTKIFTSIATGEDFRAIRYDAEGNVVLDQQLGEGDNSKANYTEKQLNNGNTEISYTEGSTQTTEIYNRNGDKISFSSIDMYDNKDDIMNHYSSVIHLAKPVINAKPKGNFSFFGIETEFQGNKKIETQTSYAEYVRNNTVYRTPEETEIRIYNQQGAIVELVNKYGEKETFSYNEKDQLLESKKVSNKGILMSKILYSYINTLLTEIKVIDGANNQVAMQLDLEYAFDNKGNWIRMRCLIDGKCEHIKNRTLTYY